MLRLKEIRKQLGLSQQEIAELIGCSSNVYSRYERGEREPSIDTLKVMSEQFNVSIDYIVGNTARELSCLTEYEKELFRLSQKADVRAKEDAILILKNHQL